MKTSWKSLSKFGALLAGAVALVVGTRVFVKHIAPAAYTEIKVSYDCDPERPLRVVITNNSSAELSEVDCYLVARAPGHSTNRLGGQPPLHHDYYIKPNSSLTVCWYIPELVNAKADNTWTYEMTECQIKSR